MGKFWCKQCSTFVDESKLERIKHEKSSRHQFALKKQLRDLHVKNKNENRELKLAKAELAKINKELGAHVKKDSFKVHKSVAKPKTATPKQETETTEKIDESVDLSKWVPVNNSESTRSFHVEPTEVDTRVPSMMKQRETEGEKEVNNWDLDKVRTVDIDDENDDTDLPKITFKKRRTPK